jgi:hypothetical protein
MLRTAIFIFFFSAATKKYAPPSWRRLRLSLCPPSKDRSGGLLLRLSALRAAQLFTRQFLMKGLATIDADLAAFIFSAHT